METKNVTDSFGFTFLVCALCYFIINFLLLSNNHFISYPVQMDDYNAFLFTHSIASWHGVRPIFYFLAPFFADLGISVYYLLMHFMVILVAASVFRFAKNFFLLSPPIEWLIFYTVLIFSFPYIIDVSRFLGAIINLCSALFAIISMLSLLKGYRENKNLFFILAATFFTVSIFTKEDFILPNVLLIFYLIFFEQKKEEQDNKNTKKKLCLYLGYSIMAIMALFLFNKYIAHSVFTGMGNIHSSDYEVKITFFSILHVIMQYLTAEIYTKNFSIIVLVISGLCMFFTNTKIKIKILFFVSCVLLLMMPYSVLPNHICNFYSYNWLPWEAILIVFGLFSLTPFLPRIIIFMFLIVFSVKCATETQIYRSRIVNFYNVESNINKNMASTLIHYKEQLNKEDRIGISGVNGLSPWAKENYIKKLGLNTKWIIFVDKSTIFFTINPNDQINQNTTINVLSDKKICDFPRMKYLFFTADGKGKLTNSCKNTG